MPVVSRQLSSQATAVQARPGIARYAQLAAVIRQRIAEGTWQPGAQLPTLEHLMDEFAAARVTVRQALSLLEDDGLIWRSRGRGTFVAERAKDATLHVGTTWDELLQSLAGNWAEPIASQSVSELPAVFRRDPSEHAAPGYRRISRIHGRDDRAHARVNLFLDLALYDQACQAFEDGMLIPVIEEIAPGHIAQARQALTIATADEETARALNLGVGAPVGHLHRVLTDADGRILYAGEVIYRGDTVRIEMQPTRPEPAQL